jgi:hypothetical protein
MTLILLLITLYTELLGSPIKPGPGLKVVASMELNPALEDTPPSSSGNP